MKKLLLAALLLPTLAQASDAVATMTPDGMVMKKSTTIAMKKQVLNVGAKEVSVDLELRNESDAEVVETIVFPLMIYPSEMTTLVTPYGPSVWNKNFWVEVDGKPVTFTTTTEALFQGRRVGAQLRRIGLSDAQIAHSAKLGGVKSLRDSQRQQLEELGLLTATPGKNELTAAWSVMVNHSWQQKFPANKIVKVHHHYFAISTAPKGWNPDSPGFAKQYCAGQDFFGALGKLKAKHGPYVDAEFTSHILKTGNSWKNGIEDFTLNVIKDHPTDVISVCFPGQLKKINKHTHQVRLTNYHPAHDLDIYFGHAAPGERHWWVK